ncbi:protocatechuate 3,4-dioxygenase subunit alpha [Nonomuraea gerenzanensis]|uniref:Protocatechuate 3,4-dioxygenase alpha chain n=1 Tax=Nonomuraea gerenzanensis TaxID=93944 RepID=A0A1M4E547_9ACTN|nr:protocatechuate 3,4-dioxygenase subunit alpha [Nonomuraea gerenzanensis]UBU16175.1 protocatechuate 3,4-dioxygenase subunit alpha [Nonomuraea gerenzanensis]SBO93985.1 Protocatechuate 3,4-dioxygenase alpha chain [Nonomuraea gerenzanensis]
MNPTPSQTVGPFYGYALPFPGGGDLASGGIAVHGYVYDGAGEPVPDALLEFWQTDANGSVAAAPGTMRRDPTNGAILGRDGVRFTGFGRVATDYDGHWALRTVVPGNGYISVCVFARGLLHHLYTRIYLGQDSFLDSLPPERRQTLVAVEEREGVHRFDIHLQGEKETVFLDFG